MELIAPEILKNPVIISLCAILLRCCVGLWPHSGEGTPPMYGDFEAQRHWLEITVSLPLSHWYRNTTDNDLLYWGLDYPPLTAYVSFLFGKIAQLSLPYAVALKESRGVETDEVKAFMRGTVLLCDVMIYFPAIWCCANYLQLKRHIKASNRTIYDTKEHDNSKQNKSSTAIYSPVEIFAMVLLQPGLVLIDHGHFQYNCVALGLAIWFVVFLCADKPFLASVMFCLSINFKQISLYYSPAIFFFLLSLSLRNVKTNSLAINFKSLLKIFYLGVAVIGTFGLLWAPFCIKQFSKPSLQGSASSINECSDGLLQVIKRIFPFHRGVFEDKVANVWCSLNTIIKFKTLFSHKNMGAICVLTTLIFLAPNCIDLLRSKPTRQKLLWAMFNSSLSFFLFSFQVHEKSILFPMLPMALLSSTVPGPSFWFGVVSTFSMSPLLFRDGLGVPYVITMTLFCVNSALTFGNDLFEIPFPRKNNIVEKYNCARPLFFLCMGCITLHFLTFLNPPERYPDLWTVLLSTYCCGVFMLYWMYGNWMQWNMPEVEDAQNKLHAE